MEPMKTITLDGVTYEITDAQARATLQQIISGLPTVDEQMRNAFTQVQNDIATAQSDIQTLEGEMTTALKPKNLYGLEDARATSANLPAQGTNSLQYLVATSTMTEAKPPIGDCKILNMEWDNTGGWTTQVAFGHAANMNASNAMAIRRMSSGTWGDWESLLDLLYPVGSVYISSTNTNPSGTLGGTWTLIEKAFNSQNITSGFFTPASGITIANQTAVLKDSSIWIRVAFSYNAAIGDTAVTVGTLDTTKIGLSSMFASYPIAHSDAGNGLALMSCTNTTWTITDVVTKTSGGTIPAGNTLQVTVPYTAETRLMLDTFCDRFYWQRTA